MRIKIPLTINTKEPSSLNGIECIEPVTVEGLASCLIPQTAGFFSKKDQNKIYDLLCELKTKKKISRKYLHTTTENCGRIYSNKHPNLQSISSKLRPRICYPNPLVEVDAQCCGPTILKNICESNDIPCDLLSSYCLDPKKYISELNTKYDIAKKLVPTLINGGYWDSWCKESNFEGLKPFFFAELEKQICNIRSIIIENNHELLEKKQNRPVVVDEIGNIIKKNAKGAVVATVLFVHECNILNALLNCLKQHGIIQNNKCVLIHDGILFPYDKKISDEILHDISAQVLNKTGFNMIYKVKYHKASSNEWNQNTEEINKFVKNIYIKKCYANDEAADKINDQFDTQFDSDFASEQDDEGCYNAGYHFDYTPDVTPDVVDHDVDEDYDIDRYRKQRCKSFDIDDDECKDQESFLNDCRSYSESNENIISKINNCENTVTETHIVFEISITNHHSVPRNVQLLQSLFVNLQKKNFIAESSVFDVKSNKTLTTMKIIFFKYNGEVVTHLNEYIKNINEKEKISINYRFEGAYCYSKNTSQQPQQLKSKGISLYHLLHFQIHCF